MLWHSFLLSAWQNMILCSLKFRSGGFSAFWGGSMLLSIAVKIIWQLMVAGCSTGDTRAAQFVLKRQRQLGSELKDYWLAEKVANPVYRSLCTWQKTDKGAFSVPVKCAMSVHRTSLCGEMGLWFPLSSEILCIVSRFVVLCTSLVWILLPLFFFHQGCLNSGKVALTFGSTHSCHRRSAECSVSEEHLLFYVHI